MLNKRYALMHVFRLKTNEERSATSKLLFPADRRTFMLYDQFLTFNLTISY